MKKILLFCAFNICLLIHAQAPYGNYLPLAQGQYCVNADTCAPAGAAHFAAAGTLDTITVEFYYKLNEAAHNTNSLLNIGTALYINEIDGYHQLFEYGGSNSNVVSNLYPDNSIIYEWNHVVLEFVPYSGTEHHCWFAVNGQRYGYINLENSDLANFFGPNRDIWLGAAYGSTFSIFYNLNDFTGYMDEFRVSSNPRYNLYLSPTYTVPTSEFATDAFTTCLLHFNGSPTDTVAYDASGNNRNFKIVRNNFTQDTIGVYTYYGFVDQDTVCYGEQVFIQGGDVYHWEPSFGVSDTTIFDPAIYLIDTTITYTVSITNTLLSYTYVDTITLIGQPIIGLATDTTVCTGVSSIALQVDPDFNDVFWSESGSTNYSDTFTTTGTYTVDANFFSGCYSHDVISINFLDSFFVDGFTYQSDSTPLPSTWIYFIDADSDNVIHHIDSTLSAIDGSFSAVVGFPHFCILVSPDSSLYPNQLPVYYDTALYIQNAIYVDVLCDTLHTNIYAQAGVNPGGPCIAGGTVVYNGRVINGDPVTHLKIILMNSSGEPIDYTFTNDTGYFVFNNLPAGNIKFYVDYMGVNNGLAPGINVSTMQDFSQLHFELFPDKLIMLGVPNVGLEEDMDFSKINLYPNPADQFVFVNIKEPEGVKYMILDSYGRTLLSSTLGKEGMMDISAFNSGIYYIRFNLGEQQKVAKLLKN
jgi:hypothetical protein